MPRDKIVHPEFNAENFKHDICLVLLNETVEFSERIQPISLPLPEETLFETESGPCSKHVTFFQAFIDLGPYRYI